jgi:hypothetical protein
MITPVSSHLDNSFGGVVEFHLDADAQPGNVIPALARWLSDLARRRRATESQNEMGGPSPAKTSARS